jgi:hypothetical protein
MTNRFLSLEVGHLLGLLGLFLMLVIARLAIRAYEVQGTRAGRLTSFLARRAIDGIAAIGWLADRLPLPAAPKMSGAAAAGDTLRARA